MYRENADWTGLVRVQVSMYVRSNAMYKFVLSSWRGFVSRAAGASVDFLKGLFKVHS